MGEIDSRSSQLSINGPPEVGCQDSRVTLNNGLIPAREIAERVGFLRRLLLLVRQKQSWSPVVITGQFWRYLINIGMRREILRLLKLRPYAEIVQNNPRFAFRYLASNYLVRGFTVKERASCFLNHYRFMYSVLPECDLHQILQGDITLYEIVKDDNHFSLSIGSPERIGDREGELSLDMRVDGRNIFNLSFTIVPGWVLKSGVAQVLLITRLQGKLGCRPQIRLARKALHEFFPGKLLVAALQGVAEAFGVCELRAICGTMQRAYSQEYSAVLKSCYDDFFANLGMTRTTAGFYATSIPIGGRPLETFKGHNRTRARKRRAMRQQIQSACAGFLLELADRASNFSSGAVNSILAQEDLESRLSPISCPAPDNNRTL